MSEIIEIDALANPHTHLREGSVIGPLIEKAIEGGADVLGPMPNTNLGLTSMEKVVNYVSEVRSSVPQDKILTFIPILMITETTKEEDINQCIGHHIFDGKVYPYDRTTKSEKGVKNYGNILSIVKHCGQVGMKVHFHPEHPSMLFGNRDAEFAFLPLVMRYLEETDAIIVWEHGTDARCIPHWEDMAKSGRFFVTLTGHHLVTTEDEIFGDVRAVCKPPIKTENDRRSLIELVAKNYNWLMAGGDDAPHPKHAKHVEQGRCACGAYTAPFLLSLYAHALNDLLKTLAGVEIFVNFTSRNARKLHRLPCAPRKIKLVNESFQIPKSYTIGPWQVEPFWAGQTLDWKLLAG